MAPSDHVMKPSLTKGGYHNPHYPGLHHYEETTEAPSTIKEIITTTINTLSSTAQQMMPDDADSRSNSSLPAGEGGANEMTNFNNTDILNMNNLTFSGEGSGGILTSTGTSFEEVTTTLLDGMQMEHMDDSEEYNTVLFIVLGVVLGVLIIVAVVLGVIYSHYRKRGFQEISGDQGQVDPQSMKQLQQASSQDALLDK